MTPAKKQIIVGDITIETLVTTDLIESFDSTVGAAGFGPGLHYHTHMDEIFYIQSGQVLVTRGEEQIIATPGMVVHIPKMTPHAWQSHEGPAKLLVTFIPGGNQARYLTELGDLTRSGASWSEGIAHLQKKYDNTPL